MNYSLNEFFDQICDKTRIKEGLINGMMNNDKIDIHLCQEELKDNTMITDEIKDIMQIENELIFKKDLIEKKYETLSLLMTKKNNKETMWTDINQIIDSYMKVLKKSDEVYKQQSEHAYHKEMIIKRKEYIYNIVINDIKNNNMLIKNDDFNKKASISSNEENAMGNFSIKSRHNPLINKVVSLRKKNNGASSLKYFPQASFKDKNQTTNDNSINIRKFINQHLITESLSVMPIKKNLHIKNIDNCQHKFTYEDQKTKELMSKTFNDKELDDTGVNSEVYDITSKTLKDITDHQITMKKLLPSKSNENKNTNNKIPKPNKKQRISSKSLLSLPNNTNHKNVKKNNKNMIISSSSSQLQQKERIIDKTRLRKGRNIQFFSSKFQEQKLLSLKARSASSTFINYSRNDEKNSNLTVIQNGHCIPQKKGELTNNFESSLVNYAQSIDQSPKAQSSVQDSNISHNHQPSIIIKAEEDEDECPKINIIMNQMNKEKCFKPQMKATHTCNQFEDIMADYKKLFVRIQEKKASTQNSMCDLNYNKYNKPFLIIINAFKKAVYHTNILELIKHKIKALNQYKIKLIIMNYISKKAYVKNLIECLKSIYKNYTQRHIIKVNESFFNKNKSEFDDFQSSNNHQQMMIHYLKNLSEIKKISEDTKTLEYDIRKIAESMNSL